MIIIDFVKNLVQESLPLNMQFVCIALEDHHKFVVNDVKMSLDAFKSVLD
jgi:hypothetical protein